MDTFQSGGKTIPVEVFLPPGTDRQPAVIVAYGTEGMSPQFGPAIRSFAGNLAAKGHVVMIPEYFKSTPVTAGIQALEAFRRERDKWVAVLSDAAAYALTRPEVKGGKTGIVGFSMGGHLALRRAKAPTGVKVDAVVDFFGPIDNPPPFDGIGDGLARMPPLLIHHGSADQVVPPQESEQLERMLTAAGKRKGTDFDAKYYAGEGHGFKGAAAVKASEQDTADFFKLHLR